MDGNLREKWTGTDHTSLANYTLSQVSSILFDIAIAFYILRLLGEYYEYIYKVGDPAEGKLDPSQEVTEDGKYHCIRI